MSGNDGPKHMLFRIAWRPNGWCGGICSDPQGNKVCEKFSYIEEGKEQAPCTAEEFYCGDEHAAFSEWWVRIHEGWQPRQLREGESLVFLLSHNPGREEALHYVGFYRLKAITEDEEGNLCKILGDPAQSTAFDPDLLELKGDEVRDRWGRPSFRYVGNDVAVKILKRALEAHKTKLQRVSPEERSRWEEVVRRIEMALGTLPGGVDLQRYFTGRGFCFTSHQLATFYTALKTKGFVILCGLSGTGKTKLAQLFVELMATGFGQSARETQRLHVFVPVCPDWRDSRSLLGYYNPLTEEFQPTEFLRFILGAVQEYKHQGKEALPRFVIFDEMNLARVEYYFADFLSVLESGRDQDGWTKEPILLHDRRECKDAEGGPIPPQIKLPPNLYFVGTVNVDETTYMFSPKVLDRAFTIEFMEVDFSKYPAGEGEELTYEDLTALGRQIRSDFVRKGRFATIDKDTVRQFVANHSTYQKHLSSLNDLLRPHDLHFGYRVFDEVMAFLANVEELPEFVHFNSLGEAFDAVVLMKVLPKFHGPRAKLEKPLQTVLAWALDPGNAREALRSGLESEMSRWTGQQQELEGEDGEPLLSGHPFTYPLTAKKALRMLRRLYTTGFASFA